VASNVSDDSALEWATVAVSQVILLEGAKPLWKIMCADFSAYHSDLRHVVELAQRAIDTRCLLEVGFLRDPVGRLMLRSVVLTDQRCETAESETKQSDRDGYLF